MLCVYSGGGWAWCRAGLLLVPVLVLVLVLVVVVLVVVGPTNPPAASGLVPESGSGRRAGASEQGAREQELTFERDLSSL